MRMKFLDYARRLVKASFAYFCVDTLRFSRKLKSLRSSFGVSVALWPARESRSSLPLDIVIPVVDKDAATLPFVIDSAREFLLHPIGDIFLVCPGDSVRVREIAGATGCRTIDEAELLPIGPGDIRYSCDGRNRASWAYQQLLKWSGGRFCASGRYLVMDSDTVFLRPQAFEVGGRIVFDACDGIHAPYFEAFERIYGMKARSALSFTSHHALIDLAVMSEMQGYIEKRNGKEWFRAIIDGIDASEMSSVSDYDNYGLYFLETRPSKMHVRYWYNKSVPRALLDDYRRQTGIYKKHFATLSFHSYS
jgi:hypothetical protein